MAHLNKEDKLAYDRQYYADNKERIAVRAKQYNEKHKEEIKTQRREYRKRNRAIQKAACARHRAAKLQRTPSWSDMDSIQLIYENAPKNYDVDHIIPLQGELVSGLHVPENLQYMYHTLNSSKWNKFEVD